MYGKYVELRLTEILMKVIGPQKPFINKKELAEALGICVKTLARKLKKKNYNIPRGLIGLEDQKKILKELAISEDSSDDSRIQQD